MKKYSSKADVALIDPVLNNKSSNNEYLIYPPANKTSHFVKITRIKDKEKRAAAMQKAVRMYNIFEKSLEVRSALPLLYDFSIWLSEHRTDFSYSTIKRNIKRATLLTETQEIFLWENLIYQIVEKQSLVVKETLIKVLVANEFIKEFLDFNQENDMYYEDILFTEEQHQKFTAIADATVVITKELLNVETSTSVIDIKDQKKQLFIEKCILLQNKIELYKEVLTDLKAINTVYDKGYTSEFDKALKQQTETITLVADDMLERHETIIDVYTGDEVDAQIHIPSFSFEVKKPLQLQSILHKVKEVSKEIIEKELIPVCKTILEGLNLLRQTILYYQKCIDIFSSKAI
ncbi:hypothetical protein [uncultured Dokdonia sp.]|uniref:hypothetical protein n=1 Tax=uncultured Dokdonia sp. TaxID=575653 RepID=UPI0026286E68|nr:hypothetical protein [uncultured Dokdonia sp.]